MASDKNVSKTAIDALQAKFSAVEFAGYRPSCDNDDDDNNNSNRTISYEVLLREMARHFGATKRQIPLVNAGYAVRVECMLQSIRTFLSFNNYANDGDDNDNDVVVQVVILGAGMDVAGLWSCLFAGTTSAKSVVVRVVEVDTSDVCRMKSVALSELCAGTGDLLRDFVEVVGPSSSSERKKEGIVFEGRIPSTNNTSNNASCSSYYTLVEADLRDLESLEKVLLPLIKPDRPTIIVSELVLAYLGRDDNCDRLLEWCSHNLVVSDSSCLLAWEPLGPTPSPPLSTEVPRIISVEEGYMRDYYQQFINKLERGHQQQQPVTKDSSTKSKTTDNTIYSRSYCHFSPLESSCALIEKRLRRCGFGRVHSALAGEVAVAVALADPVSSSCLRTKEVFDEHAALTLHLRSYAIVCAFAANKHTARRTPDDPLFRLSMCPWICVSGVDDCPFVPPQLRTLKKMNNTNVWLTRIERQDEKRIRSLFSQAYQHLFEDHPAIRKMVKTALRKDLGDARPVNSRDLDGQDELSSAIRDHYTESGGFFLVAVLRQRQTQQNDEDETTNRRVIGGIGLRRLTQKEIETRRFPLLNCYEIHRLVVDESFQGCGAGKALLQRAVEVLAMKTKLKTGSGANNRSFQILATTPALLEKSNLFYMGSGFEIQSDTDIGHLTMRTYCKTVDPGGNI